MIKLTNIKKEFGGQAVLKGVSFSIPTGQTYALVGSSGSGKSTVLRIIMGLIHPDSGEFDVDVPGADTSKALGFQTVAYVPQDGGLFPHMTAMENIALPASLRGWSNERIRARIEQLLELVPLNSDLFDRLPRQLSGGQRQRISLIRALLLDPPILLLDEPFGALDPLIRFELQSEMKSLFKRLKKTVVFVTHDMGEAGFLASQLIVMREGQVVQTGQLQELLDSPKDPFVEAFLKTYRQLEVDA